MNNNILLLGSYNGQDSLGDKCLLRAVSYRFNSLIKEDSQIFFHLHNPSEFKTELKDVPVVANQGIQSIYWLWDSQLSRFRLPEKSRKLFSERAFRLAYYTFFNFYKKHKKGTSHPQIKKSSFIFIFGGTNFSKQWWWLNIVPYMLTAKIGNLPVYFGTQQYGPMLTDQQKRTQKFMSKYVKGVRFRNPACFKELGMPDSFDKLTKDEVYSNVSLYPNPVKRSASNTDKKTILINYRGTQDFLLENPKKELERLAIIMNKIGAQYDCNFTFFSVSGASFSDDTEAIAKLREMVDTNLTFETLPYTNEFDLIEKAKQAYACISMSFHGCILAMIAGCPAIPLSSGDYYDHKYIHFETYNPANPIPIVYLSQDASNAQVQKMIDYFDTYDIKAVNEEREKSNLQIESYYKEILSTHNLLA